MFKKSLVPFVGLLALIILPTALYAADETYLTDETVYDLSKKYKTDWHKPFQNKPAQDKLLYIKKASNGCDEVFMVNLDAAHDTDGDGVGTKTETQLTHECNANVGDKRDAHFGIFFKEFTYDSDGDGVTDTTVKDTWSIVFAAKDGGVTGGSDIWIKPIGGNLDSPITTHGAAKLTKTDFSKGEYAINPVMNFGLGANPFYVAYERHKSIETGKNSSTPYTYDAIHVVSGDPANVVHTALKDKNLTYRHGDNCNKISVDNYHFVSPHWFRDGKNLTAEAITNKTKSHIMTVNYQEEVSLVASGGTLTGHDACSRYTVHDILQPGFAPSFPTTSKTSPFGWSSLVVWTDLKGSPSTNLRRIEPKPSPIPTHTWSYTYPPTPGSSVSVPVSTSDFGLLYHREKKGGGTELAKFGVTQINIPTNPMVDGEIILWGGSEELITGFKNKTDRRRPVWDIISTMPTIPDPDYWIAYEVKDANGFWQIAGTQIDIPHVHVTPPLIAPLASSQDQPITNNPFFVFAKKFLSLFNGSTAFAKELTSLTQENLQVEVDPLKPSILRLVDKTNGVSIPVAVVGLVEKDGKINLETMVDQFEANIQNIKDFHYTKSKASMVISGTSKSLGSVNIFMAQRNLQTTLAKNQMFYIQFTPQQTVALNNAFNNSVKNHVANTSSLFGSLLRSRTRLLPTVVPTKTLPVSPTIPTPTITVTSGLPVKLPVRLEYLWTACPNNHFYPRFNHASLNVDTSTPMTKFPHDLAYVMEKFESGIAVDHPVMYLLDLPTRVAPICVEGCNAADGDPLYNTATQGYTAYTSEIIDSDGDGEPDACDACPEPAQDPNAGSPYNYGFLYDSNNNGLYTDIGIDTCEEATENCEDEGYNVYYPWTTPSEYVTGDGAVYYTIDGDWDFYNDACDSCPEDPSAFVTFPYDLNGDGIGDSCINAASEASSACCDSCGCSGDVSATATVGDITVEGGDINITITGDTSSDTSGTTTGETIDEDPALVIDEVPDTEGACEEAGGMWDGGECGGLAMTGGCACDIGSNTRISWSYFMLALMMSLVIGFPYVVVRKRVVRPSTSSG